MMFLTIHIFFIIILLINMITNMNSFQLNMMSNNYNHNNIKDNSNNIQINKKKNSVRFLYSNINSFIKTKVIKIIPTILGATLFIINPLPSFAARSGGRSGGSSFHSSSSRSSSPSSSRSSSSSRSRSSSRRSSSSSRTRLSSGSSSSSSVLSSLSEASVVTESSIADDAITTIIIGAMILSSFWSIKKENRSLGSGITVLKLQISLDMDWLKHDNIINIVYDIAQRKGKINDRKDLATLLSDTSLALLRKKDSFNSASLTSNRFDDDDDNIIKAESYFQKLAIHERAKFESEINPTLLIMPSLSSQLSSELLSSSSTSAHETRELLSLSSDITTTTRTQAVVSLIVAIHGKSDTYGKPIRSTVDLSDCLQLLASEALTDNGENIMAVEVLWTPSQPGTIVTDRELISDYPELIKL